MSMLPRLKKIKESYSFLFAKKLAKDFSWLVYVYLAACLFYIIFFFIFSSFTTSLLDKLFGCGFGLSFSASYLEDLLAFLFLGFLLTYISMALSLKRPEDYSYEERIKALVNNSEVLTDDTGLLNFLNSHISKLLVCNTNATYEIHIQDYDEKELAYRIFVNIRLSLTNMCKDRNFIITSLNSYAASDLEVVNKPNYVSYLGQFNPKNGADISEEAIIPFTKEFENNTFTNTISLEIPRNEKIGWRFGFSVWYKTSFEKPLVTSKNNWFYLVTERYTKTPKIKIINALVSEKEVIFDLGHKKNSFDDDMEVLTLQKQDIKLRFKEVEEFYLEQNLFPLDNIYLYLKPQTKEASNDNS